MFALLAMHSLSVGPGAPIAPRSTWLHQESVWGKSWIGILAMDVRPHPSTTGKNRDNQGSKH